MIEWEDCDKRYECGTLEVPMDYDDPDGDVFTLALGRRAAANPNERIGSLLLLPGGPGGSGLRMLECIVLYFTEEFMSRYVVIGFDPRGGCASELVVNCLSYAVCDYSR